MSLLARVAQVPHLILKRASMVVAGVLALGLVTFILRQHAATDSEGLWQGTSEPAASDAGPAAGPEASAPAELSAARSGSREPKNTAAADLQLPENPKVTLPRDHMAAGYRSETWNAILEDPPELARRGDPEVDAETAYRLYLYLRWCGSVATTERQAEVQFQQFAEEIAGATDESQYVEPGQIAEAEQLALKMQLGRDD